MTEPTMRLKTADGPLSVHNGNNPDIVNSPKRINTLQNSNVTTNIETSDLTANNINSNSLITDITIRTDDENTLNNINTEDVVQWCNSAHTQKREFTNNAHNRPQQFNINNTLAATLRGGRQGTASSVCSECSPDDSLLDYEDAHQSSSSVDTSPQDEDRGFDISDSDSSSEEANFSNHNVQRGIVNPNYPGFQHLAHTLNYGLKTVTDADFTDDDFECESFTAKQNAETNNNNNVEDIEYKIDSVNRLDSVENIQKVFYDKPVLNIPSACENLKRINCDSDEASGSASNQGSDDDFDVTRKTEFNIQSEGIDKPTENIEKIIGDFGQEIEREFGRIRSENSQLTDAELPAKKLCIPVTERGIEQELEEAVEKLSVSHDLQPSATKYNIEPNTEQPFSKFETARINSVILQEAETVKQSTMTAISAANQSLLNDNIKTSGSKNFLNHLVREEINMKISDAFLSGVHDNLPKLQELENKTLLDQRNANAVSEYQMEVDSDIFQIKPGPIDDRKDSNIEDEEKSAENKKSDENMFKNETKPDELEKFCKEDVTKGDKEKDEDTVVPRKKEKMEINYVKKRRDYNQQIGSLITIPRRELGGRTRENFNRRSVPVMRDKRKPSPESLGGFDVYNIETAMPKIDLDAIESHLRAAREEERRRRTDREEIRRRLAMGSEDDYYINCDRPGRKPSLQARLQSGMNLQICFMNETASDTESPNSDSESPITNSKQLKSPIIPSIKLPETITPLRPATLSIGKPLLQAITEPMTEADFFARQARLQTEARMALAQAKEMARMQMEIERQRQKKSPITEMVRHSLEKVGIQFPEDRRRLSRQILTEMNVAQLQVIVNDLHTQIETLNENLVKFLMCRDDLHMEQDSMLVDIEDLTRYLGAKEQALKGEKQTSQSNNIPPPSPAPSSPPRSPLAALNSTVKPHLHRIASLVKK